MSVLATDPHDEVDLEEALRPFLAANQESARELIDGLEERGWVAPDVHCRYSLTGEGRAVHGVVTEDVKEIRGRLADGITKAQYAATIEVLATMAGNLEGLPD